MASLTGSTTAVFFVRLSTAVDEIVNVDWNTRDGTAIAGKDYEAASGTVSFLPGETEKTIDVVVYGQDNVSADGKKFYIELKPPANAVLTDALAECVITVADEDGLLITSLVIAQGKRGLKGNPGLSAYEQAVLMGYTGTVAQWMDEIGDASQAADRAQGFAASSATQAQISTQKSAEAIAAVNTTKIYVDSAISDLSTAANKFYPTLMAANSDISNIEVNQPVTIGDIEDGGLWYKANIDSTTLSKSQYDPLKQSKEFTTASVNVVSSDVKEKILHRPAENILNLVDGDGKLSMSVDTDGGLHLTGLEKTVQDEIKTIKDIRKNFDVNKENTNLLELHDNNGNKYVFIDSNSQLVLTGLTQSVQSILNCDNLSSKSNEFIRDNKSLVLNSVQSYLVSCLSGGGVISPMPFSQAPHNFSPPASLIDVKISQGQRLVVDTVYRKDDGVVHPHVLEFRNGFLGYRYILGLTPYYLTQDKYENPCIYGSHDLQNFELIDKFQQPFSEQPIAELAEQYAYNSDDFFTYDFYSGELLFCWRRTYDNVDPRNEIWGRRTKNGLDWTQEELLYNGKSLGGIVISPSIIFNFSTGLFELFTVELTQSGWRIRKKTSPTLKNPKWVHDKYFQPIPNAQIWHLDVRYVGDKIYAMAHDDAMTGENSTKNLYLGVYDETTGEFIWSGAMITGEHYDPYKATFTPILDLDSNSMALQVLWSSRSGGDENMWRLYSSKSNSVNL